MFLGVAVLQESAFAGSTWRLAAGGLFTALLVAACVTDLRWRRIPNWLALALAVLGIGYSIAVDPGLAGVGRGVGGLFVGFSIWILFFVVGGMGAGDVKLIAAASAWLGPNGAWRASLVAALLGGILSLVALLAQRRLREGTQRVAIAMSTMSIAPLGAVAPDVERRRYLPYGIALAGGALLVAWFPQILG